MGFWEASAELKLIPALGVIREIPKVGFELQGVDDSVELRYPGLRLRLGQRVRFYGEAHKPTGVYEYGLLISPNWPQATLGLIQTDHHLGFMISYLFMMLWWLDHPTVRILLHPDLKRPMREFVLPERFYYG